LKKSTTVAKSPKRTAVRKRKPITIGMDLGDKSSRYCVLDEDGEVLLERSASTSRKGMAQAFGAIQRCRIAIEVGTHSPWVSRLLKGFGHEVIVANARQVKLISASSRKDDRLDAQTLARLARVDPKLLRPIQHRSEKAQMDLMVIRVRASLVEARTRLVNTARGLAKSVGERLPQCDTDSLGVKHMESFPPGMRETLKPLLDNVEVLTQQIKELDVRIEQIARTEYPETERLRQVSGVGVLIALTYVLTVADRDRFEKSRDVGCYVGLRPRRSESGQSQPQLRISKEGDRYLRSLAIQGAQHILSKRGPDTDLKRWGLKLAGRGGKNAKKRAVVAVARKLMILLHRLWVSGERYEPLRNSQAAAPPRKRMAA